MSFGGVLGVCNYEVWVWRLRETRGMKQGGANKQRGGAKAAEVELKGTREAKCHSRVQRRARGRRPAPPTS